MRPISAAGLIYGPQMHYLDHLGPLCALLKIPLFVTEEAIELVATRYYPGLNVLRFPALSAPHEIVKNYQCLFSCLPKPLFNEIFYLPEQLYRNKLLSIWVPHGNPAKGETSYFLEALKDETVALVYGSKMHCALQEKGILERLVATIFLGNFRYEYTLSHKNFYKELCAKIFPKKRNILYAPTWEDYENSTTFFSSIDTLLKQLPDKYHLIVKPHPNSLLTDRHRIDKYIRDHKEVQFLLDFPPIYPLLHHTSIYLGDLSSIGYDFLTFNRPMFFLKRKEQKSSLYSCGTTILPERVDSICEEMEKALPCDAKLYSDKRKEMYDACFGREKPFASVEKEIRSVCSRLL